MKKIFMVMVLLTGMVKISLAQKDKQAVLQELINKRTFSFEAETALPQRGRMIPISYGYGLKINKDTLNADLPYFGRAFVAPIDPSQGGIRFTTTDFDYQAKEGRKGGWDIMIKPRNHNDVQQMQLSISADGYASLQVTSNNREPITFRGKINVRK